LQKHGQVSIKPPSEDARVRVIELTLESKILHEKAFPLTSPRAESGQAKPVTKQSLPVSEAAESSPER
jgi:hypothetical protein